MEQLSTLTSWMNENAGSTETILFYILASLAIPFAYGVVFDRKIIRSGFLLIGMFGAVSALFLLLHAQFLAMAQIMIYAVGITLVVVIALMLTNPKLENELSPQSGHSGVWSFFFALLLFMTIYMAVRSEGWPVKTQDIVDADNLMVIGRALTTDYALPFEFSSVLLLAALIGAIMLAKAEPPVQSMEYSDDAETPEPALTTTSSR